MFKSLVGKGHPEFSTKKQQDAQEYFLHIISMIEVLYLLTLSLSKIFTSIKFVSSLNNLNKVKGDPLIKLFFHGLLY